LEKGKGKCLFLGRNLGGEGGKKKIYSPRTIVLKSVTHGIKKKASVLLVFEAPEEELTRVSPGYFIRIRKQ